MKTLLSVCALLVAAVAAGAAEQQVWVPGHWQADRSGDRQWVAGYYTTAIVPDAAPATPPPQPVWVAGRWIWQNNAWVWQEGHWELPSQPAPAPAPVIVQPTVVAAPPVVVEQPEPVVVVDSCPPPIVVERCPPPAYCPPVVVEEGRPRHHVDVVVHGALPPLPLPPLIHGSVHGHGFVGLPGLPPIPTPHELGKLFR